MHFVVEIMQQRRDRPLRFVFVIFSRVGRDASFNSQGVAAKTFRFGELVEDREGLVAGDYFFVPSQVPSPNSASFTVPFIFVALTMEPL